MKLDQNLVVQRLVVDWPYLLKDSSVIELVAIKSAIAVEVVAITMVG